MCGLRVNGVDAAAVEVRLAVVAGGPTVLEVVALGGRVPMGRRAVEDDRSDGSWRWVARAVVRACLHAQARRLEHTDSRSLGPGDVAPLAVDMVLEVDSLRFAPLVPSEGA